jgi:hypothetical protein
MTFSETLRGSRLGPPPLPNRKCDSNAGSRASETIRNHVFQRSTIFGKKRPGTIFSLTAPPCRSQSGGRIDPRAEAVSIPLKGFVEVLG